MLRTLIRWFQAPRFPDDEDKTRRALLLNVLLNTFIIALPVIIVGVLLGRPVPRYEAIIRGLIVAWLLVTGLRYMMLAGWITVAGMMLVGIIFLLTTFSIYNLGTIRAPATAYYFLVVVTSGLIVSQRAILWMAGLSTITVIGLLNAEIRGLLPQPDFSVRITQGVTFSVAMVIISILLFLATKSIDEALARARQELAERIRVEKEREKYIEELGKQNAELERFTYTVSHDLRNPLVTIKGFLGSLEKDLQDGRPDRLQSDFKRIASATDKMDTLISELLELSRIGRLMNPPEEVDLARLVQEAIASLDARIHTKRIAVNVSPDLPRVSGDRVRLREVFENLIDNAAKYMGEQPDPLIEIGIRGKEDPVFFIKDNGIGIEPQYHRKIFSLFEKLDPTIEGTGIGLALVKRIIEFHGGRIWVESEGPGKGATFCFTIPNSSTR